MHLALIIAMVISLLLCMLTLFGLLGYINTTEKPSRSHVIKTLRMSITCLNVFLIAIVLDYILTNFIGG